MKELSLHILDLVQNSITAGAKLIEITIEEDKRIDLFQISIKDNGCGMDKELIEKIKDPFYTTRTTRKVGLGIPLMEAACMRCDGELSIESEKKVGTKIVASFRDSHIDRAPLGNIIDTFISILLVNDEIDYIYKQIVNGKEFVINTKELKVILGEGVSITNIEVLTWIKEFMDEGIRNLMEV